MFEAKRSRWSWSFVAMALITAAVLLSGLGQASGPDDHERVRELRTDGTILPLAQILNRDDLAGLRVVEAELEHEHGRLVYELELLDDRGRVRKRYFDAETGEPIGRDEGH
jgi:uncharacterized membrane protein YkoI